MGQERMGVIGYESVPIVGGFTASVKGYAYLVFWKRPIKETQQKEQDTWVQPKVGRFRAVNFRFSAVGNLGNRRALSAQVAESED